MDLKAIINAVADEADSLLAGVTSKNEARTTILTYLIENEPDLSPGDAARVCSGVIALLDNEGFFEFTAGSDPFAEAEGTDAEP